MSVQQADPLEDVLALVGTTSRLSTGLIAGGSWALDFDPPPAVKFNAVRRGRCLLVAGGVTYPLEEGDCFLLTRSQRFVLASAAEVTPQPAGPVFAAAGPDGLARTGTGDDVFLLGGRFDFGARARELLLDALPPVLHVPGGAPAAATLRWALDQVDAELRDRPIASVLVAEHLALIMLIHILRLHLATAGSANPGWLGGLADPVVAPALRALHADPARPWTVADLAAVSTVSRSTLAARFKQSVGQGPLDYLTGWRIELAAARLRRGDGTLAAIAHAVGYGSESALSTAFKRITGTTPRDYRRS
ncbi:AraC family transcriptional regulator [Paractinoplanes durhamensis]|uniref:AraC family transcriptional regulator n=1 Tax=Paractinoplanes durhamensis TaxID=113563 RepID=A0ABQ3YTW1_9ACTN|nr:AraC family transcriptional regulator [Actinoplanes durhamensis]GIE00967.1 AraC family transcriptional regulator [Actinoplanes durhamensis]